MLRMNTSLYFKNIGKNRTVHAVTWYHRCSGLYSIRCSYGDRWNFHDCFMALKNCTMSFCFPFQIFILLQFTCNCCLISYEQSYLFSYFLFLFCYHWYVLWIITFHFDIYIKEKCYFWFFFVHNMCIINFKSDYFLSDWQCSNIKF